MRFNHLNIPDQWETYWSKYPQGYTILEALIQWVQQVDNMVDNQNNLNETITNFRKELDTFVETFEKGLQAEVTRVLREWQDSGYLEIVISEALQTQITEVDNRLTPMVNKNTADILKRLELITDAVTYTVGAAGDFQTINEALTVITRKHPTYKFGGVGTGITLRLLAGFVMREQVWVNSLNLSYIHLRSVDPEVIIDRQFLTGSLGSVDRYPAFAFTDGATSPMIYVLFNMNETGEADQRNGFNVRLGSWILLQSGAGCKNAGGRGLHVANGFGYANGGIFTGCKQAGIRVANAGRLWADGAKVDGSLVGFMTDEGYISARDSTAHNCGTAARIVGGRADLRGLKSDNCGTVLDATEQASIMMRDAIGKFATGTAIFLQRNCLLYADFADFSNCSGAVPLNINDSNMYARFSNLVPIGEHTMSVTSCKDINITSAKIKRMSILHGSQVNAKNADVSAYTGTAVHFTLSGRGNQLIMEGVVGGTANMPLNQFNATGLIFS